MSFDYQQALFHVGVRVPDLEAAMAELTAGLGFTWAQVVERDQALWTPERGQHTVRLRFTYSCEGPQHVELLQGETGSMWDGGDAPGVHHQGVWVDDVGGRGRASRRCGVDARGGGTIAGERLRPDGLRPLTRWLPARTSRRRRCARGSTVGGPGDRSTSAAVASGWPQSRIRAVATQKPAETMPTQFLESPLSHGSAIATWW